jgi:hypothetical protein
MKRLLTLVITMFLGSSLALAQTGGDKKNPQPPPGKVAPAASTKSGKKGHKGGKKGERGKKNAGSTTTTQSPK